MRKNKKKKKIVKISKYIKKLKIYLFYLRRYPYAFFKALIFLFTNPRYFLQKLRRVEKKLSYIVPEDNFNWLNFFSQKKILSAFKILFTQGPKGLIEKIKIFLNKSHFTHVNKKISQEFINYFKKRKDNYFDIFIFGITAFDYRIQRPQHFAFELAKKGHRIFYIENEFLINEKVDENNFAPYMIKKRAENIYLIKLSSFYNYFIYNQTPKRSDINLMFSSIKKLIYDAKVINPIAKIDHPFWGFLKDKLSMPIIYDCMDEHAGFKENSKKIIAKEKELIKESDLVIASSDYLYKKLEKLKPKKLIKIYNGCEFNHFNQILYRKINKPDDLKNIKKPIIGYYGAIDYWVDTDLVESFLKKYPQNSFVFIGRINNAIIYPLSKKYKNFYLLGEKKYQKLPYYLSYFDVCLIPFKVNKLIKATHPVKIYEYLSVGKPVVTTALPEIKYLKEIIYYSKNNNEFIKNIDIALKEKDQSLIKKRIFIAKNNTWEKRVKDLEIEMNDKFYPKVSIVVLSFFQWQLIKKCLDSILKYSFYPNYEIIIVDNNSDIETKKYLKNLKDPRIKVIFSEKNLGFGGGNNLGMKNAKGDFIIILNNDTIITPGWIYKLVYYDKKENIGLVGPITNNIGNEAKININYNSENIKDIFEKVSFYTSSHWGEKLEVKRIAAFCWIKKSALFRKIGGFDERFFPAFFEDDDYCLRVKKLGLKIFIVEDVFIHHHLGKSSGADKNIFENKFFIENKKKFEEKWGIKWQPHKYRKGII